MQGNDFSAYLLIYCSRTNLGNKSDGEKLVKTIANINNNKYNLDNGFGCTTYQMDTPTNAIILVGDSEPELNMTVKISTEANNISRNACCLYCEIRRYCSPKSRIPEIKNGKLDIVASSQTLRTKPMRHMSWREFKPAF